MIWAANPDTNAFVYSPDPDNASVVYDAVRGQSHLIEPVALRLFQLVKASPQSTVKLALEVNEFFFEARPDETLEFVEATLIQLQRIGLLVKNSS